MHAHKNSEKGSPRGPMGNLLRLAGLLIALFVLFMVGLHLGLNVWLPLLVNQQAERVRLSVGVAWMVRPGEVSVRNLQIRQQGLADQWILTLDEATATIDFSDLFDHTFHITTAAGHGATFRWRARLDAPSAELPLPLKAEGEIPQSLVSNGAFKVVEDTSPPIPGLSNPPDPTPESLYPQGTPWRIVLEDLHCYGIREIWLGGYRYGGDATASGALTLEARKWREVDGVTLMLNGGDLHRGADTMLRGVKGVVDLEVLGADPADLDGRSLFGTISARVALAADIADLSFLDFYLRSAPWLHLTGGAGRLAIDMDVVDGTFQDGSKVSADVKDLVALFRSYSIIGDGEVRLAVGKEDGAPRTTLNVDFLDFQISKQGDQAPHVQGQGFRVSASTADVALDQPFTTLDVVMELPEAEIADVGVYNTYLPRDLGLVLHDGSGTVRGHLEVSTEQNLAHGELFLHAHAVQATLDELSLGADVSVHLIVPSGEVDTGIYDISGTSVDLNRVRIVSGSSTRAGKDDSEGWWARVRLPIGEIAMGAPIFLDGRLSADFRDTVPFVTVFSEKQSLPGWVRGLLDVGPVDGEARIRMGDAVLRVSDFQVLAGQFEVLMELSRRRSVSGKLFARMGILSLGIGLVDEQSQVHLFRARKWYDEEPDPD